MKKDFDILLKTDLRFGCGKIKDIGEIVASFGKKTMLVTCPWPAVQVDSFNAIIRDMEAAGVEVIVYDKATPNPTVQCIEEAGAIARKEGISSVVGLGGGSAMDTAKGVSVCFAHDGGIWDYTYVVENPLPIDPEKLLPVIAITTTSGTGSQMTPYCVLQDPNRKRKTCVVANAAMLPAVSIVDPELAMTMPPFITATTGFDAFAHAFEAYVDQNTNPFVEMLALKTIELCLANLEKACKDGSDLEARTQMSMADTWAGMCIFLNNTTMPHDVGQAIVGKDPRIAHGLSVAMIFPEYVMYAFGNGQYPEKLQKLGEAFDKGLGTKHDVWSAELLRDSIVDWQKRIGIFASGESLGLSEDIKKAVAYEAYINCPFLTQICGKTEAEINEIVDRIWTQK